MDTWQQHVNEQVEKLSYLEGKKEKNMEILKKRVRELEEEKKRKAYNGIKE